MIMRHGLVMNLMKFLPSSPVHFAVNLIFRPDAILYLKELPCHLFGMFRQNKLPTAHKS